MSFAQEMKDFIAAFKVGSSIWGRGALDDREYKRLRNLYLMQRIKEYPQNQQLIRELRRQRMRDSNDRHEEHLERMKRYRAPDPNAPPSADDILTGPRSAIDTGEDVADVGGDRQKYAYDYFIDKGYSPVEAAGIVGGLRGETENLNTRQIHDGGIGYGIAGWNGERLAGLKRYARANGLDPADLDTQLGYVDHELHTTEKGALAKLNSARTPQQAGQAMLSYFRPAGYDQPGAHPERARYAAAVFKQYGNGSTEMSARSALPMAYADTSTGNRRANPLADPSYDPWSDKTLMGGPASAALPYADKDSDGDVTDNDSDNDSDNSSSAIDESGGYAGGAITNSLGDSAPEVTGTAFDFESPAGIDFTGLFANGGLVKRYAGGDLVDEDDEFDEGADEDDDSADESTSDEPDVEDQEAIPTRPVQTVPIQGSGKKPVMTFSQLAVRDALATGMGAIKRGLFQPQSESPQQALPSGAEAEADVAPDEALDLSAKSKTPQQPAAMTVGRAPRTKFSASQTAAGGAMPTPQEFQRLKDMVDPNHELSEGMRTAKAYAAVHEFYMRRGEPEKAARILGQMVLYNRQKFVQWNAIAAAAAQHGDMDGAAKAMLKAYANIPDGGDLKIAKNQDGSLTWTQVDTDGNQIRQGVIRSPSDMAKIAMNWGGPGMFDHLVTEAINGPLKPEQPKPPSLKNRAAADKMLSGGETGTDVTQTMGADGKTSTSIFPAGTENEGRFIAGDILQNSNVSPAAAAKTAAALFDPSVKIETQPQEDGGAIVYMPGSRVPMRLSRNAFLQAVAIRGKQRELADQKANAAMEKEGLGNDSYGTPQEIDDAIALSRPYQNARAAKERFKRARRAYATQ